MAEGTNPKGCIPVNSATKTKTSKTMAFLLRHRPDVGDLSLDEQGWVCEEALRGALKRLLRIELDAQTLINIIEDAPVRRFEHKDGRIRASAKVQAHNNAKRTIPPDILYHATTSDRVGAIVRTGSLDPGPNGHVFLASSESKAWRTAHRLQGGACPKVLVVDACRARRQGVTFLRDRKTGLFLSNKIPTRHLINLRQGFGLQFSAGGFPVIQDNEGNFKIALVRVTRRSGVTWEVAKGKLEIGETPETAAVREVREEMGVSVHFTIDQHIADIRYGFTVPNGRVLLKTIHLYLMTPTGDIGQFRPATAEGIDDVAWFGLDEAVRAVTHSSLIPVMHQLRDVLRSRQRPPS
jgi:putative RNA 2'-phosphotransferase